MGSNHQVLAGILDHKQPLAIYQEYSSVFGIHRGWRTTRNLFILIGLIAGLTFGGSFNASALALPFRSGAAPNKISETSPPEVIQTLRQELEKYQPQVSILSPKNNVVLQDDTVTVQVQVKDLPLFKDAKLGLGPHLHLFLDDQPYQAIYDPRQPIVLKDVAPGTHTLRLFAGRPWHESFKNDGAYAQTTFHVFTKTQTNNPATNLPLLTYSRPQGSYGAEPIMLDFYLTNAPLHLVAQEDKADEFPDWRIQVTVNGDRFVMDQWEPLYLKGFKPGKNWVQVEYIDEQGNPLQNVYNNTVRLINYEPNGQDTLAQLVRGDLSVEQAKGIVDPTYVPPVAPAPEPVAEPSPQPSPVASPAPSPEPSPIAAPSPAPKLTPAPIPVMPIAKPTPAPEIRVTPSPAVPVIPAEDVPILSEPIAPESTPESPPTATSKPSAGGIFDRFRKLIPQQSPTPVESPTSPPTPEPPAIDSEPAVVAPPAEAPSTVSPDNRPSVLETQAAKLKGQASGLFNRFRNLLPSPETEPAPPTETPTPAPKPLTSPEPTAAASDDQAPTAAPQASRNRFRRARPEPVASPSVSATTPDASTPPNESTAVELEAPPSSAAKRKFHDRDRRVSPPPQAEPTVAPTATAPEPIAPAVSPPVESSPANLMNRFRRRGPKAEPKVTPSPADGLTPAPVEEAPASASVKSAPTKSAPSQPEALSAFERLRRSPQTTPDPNAPVDRVVPSTPATAPNWMFPKTTPIVSPLVAPSSVGKSAPAQPLTTSTTPPPSVAKPTPAEVSPVEPAPAAEKADQSEPSALSDLVKSLKASNPTPSPQPSTVKPALAADQDKSASAAADKSIQSSISDRIKSLQAPKLTPPAATPPVKPAAAIADQAQSPPEAGEQDQKSSITDLIKSLQAPKPTAPTAAKPTQPPMESSPIPLPETLTAPAEEAQPLRLSPKG